jgi:hypothetical protein
MYDTANSSVVVVDYKTRIGDTTQDPSKGADSQHVLQVILNAYLVACCTKIVPDTCAIIYGNRGLDQGGKGLGQRGKGSEKDNQNSNATIVGSCVSFPFKADLAPGSFITRALAAIFSALPALYTLGPYVFGLAHPGLQAPSFLRRPLSPMNE